MRTSIKTTLATALLALPVASQAAFVVDGIDTAGEYASFFDVPYFNENNNTSVADGIGSVALGYDTLAESIYILLEVPTEIQDLTYSGFEYKKGIFKDSGGAATSTANQNAAAGWYEGPNLDHAAYKKVQGSEKWRFDLAGEAVEIKMKDSGNNGTGTGYEIKKNGAGKVVAASTSLDYNMNGDAGGAVNGFNINYSPECENPISNPLPDATGDQDCYDDLEANYPDYQYAQRYEIEINNSDNAFGLSSEELAGIFTDLSFFAANIDNSNFHASKPKGAGGHDFDIPCIDAGDCPEPPPCDVNCGEVPVPGALLLWGAALTALAATRRRRILRATKQ